MKMSLIDKRMRNITIKNVSMSELSAMGEQRHGSHITTKEIEDYFGFSKNQAGEYLAEVGAAPIGRVKGSKRGSRDYGQVLYSKDVIDSICKSLEETVDIDAVKRMAERVLEEYRGAGE